MSSPSAIRRSLRRGFTLIELLVVITTIALLAGIFISLTPGDGGGLPAGQQMVASSIRSLRAMALMNRGVSASGVSYNVRYRLLILNDPTDPANHLRQFVLAIGGSDVAATVNDTSLNWVSPAPPSVLPNGVYFMPPDKSTTIIPYGNAYGLAKKRAIADGLTIISPFADADRVKLAQGAFTYLPVTTPTPILTMSTQLGGAPLKKWYFVELQPSGASNHIGRVVLVLGSGNSRLASSGKVEIDLAGDGKLAAICLRPNGDVSLSNDSDDLTTDTLKL